MPRIHQSLLAAALFVGASQLGCGTVPTAPTGVDDAAPPSAKPRPDAGSHERTTDTNEPDARGRDRRDASSPGAPTAPVEHAGVGSDAGQAGDASGTAQSADAASTSADATSRCPANSKLAVGDTRLSLEHQGRTRKYLVHVPSKLAPQQPVPLVLDFHGNGSSAMQESSGSGWKEKGDREGFVVAWPDGVGGGWNVGNCCGEALSSKVDDVGVARAIVAAISAEACIDPRRVYATGISNGAGLAHRLACEAADVFAAIAAASADLVTDPCKPVRPIAELSVRGLNDTLVAYAGGNTGSTGWYSPGAKGTLTLWKNIDGCTGMPLSKREYCETYAECSAGVEVTLCSLPRTGHILYDNSVGFDVPEVAWELFSRQRLP